MGAAWPPCSFRQAGVAPAALRAPFLRLSLKGWVTFLQVARLTPTQAHSDVTYCFPILRVSSPTTDHSSLSAQTPAQVPGTRVPRHRPQEEPRGARLPVCRMN